MNTAHLKERLQDEKATLEEQLKTVGRRNPSNPNDWEAVPTDTGMEPDPTDQADLMENYEENTAILKDLEIRFNTVSEALLRMENGSYGVCEVCGEEIGEDRLEAEPAASTCKTHLNG